MKFKSLSIFLIPTLILCFFSMYLHKLEHRVEKVANEEMAFYTKDHNLLISNNECFTCGLLKNIKLNSYFEKEENLLTLNFSKEIFFSSYKSFFKQNLLNLSFSRDPPLV